MCTCKACGNLTKDFFFFSMSRVLGLMAQWKKTQDLNLLACSMIAICHMELLSTWNEDSHLRYTVSAKYTRISEILV